MDSIGDEMDSMFVSTGEVTINKPNHGESKIMGTPLFSVKKGSGALT
jgi:hypothetical protein